MIKFLAELMTFYIPNKNFRKKIQSDLRTFMFGYRIIKKAKKSWERIIYQ